MHVSDIVGGFTVETVEGKSDADALRVFSKSPILSDYVTLVSESGMLELSHENGAYLRIWEPGYAREMDDAYRISEYLPGAIPVGDDGSGRALLFWDGPRGRALYLCELGALFPDEAVFVAPTLTALLRLGQGTGALLLG